MIYVYDEATQSEHMFPRSKYIKISDLRADCVRLPDPPFSLPKSCDPDCVSFSLDGRSLEDRDLISGLPVPLRVTMAIARMREYVINVNGWEIRRCFSERATIGDCQRFLTRRFLFSSQGILVADGRTRKSDDDKLVGFRTGRLAWLVPDLVVLRIANEGPLVMHSSLTVLDAICAIHSTKKRLCDLFLRLRDRDLRHEIVLKNLKIGDGEKLECAEEAEWEARESEVAFRLPWGVVCRQTFPARASLCFVRFTLARKFTIPVHRLRFWRGNELTFSEMRAELADCPSDPISLQSPAFRIDLISVDSPRKKYSMDVSLLDRVYDIRLRFAALHNFPKTKLGLMIATKRLDDETLLGEIGFSVGTVLHFKLFDSGFHRLYFVDWELKKEIFDFPDCLPINFASIADRFYSIPSAVTFWNKERQISPLDPVESVPGDPAWPISVRLQKLMAKIQFCGKVQKHEEVLEIEAETRAADVVRHFSSDPELTFLMSVHNRLLQNEQLVIINPFLLLPFRLEVRERRSLLPSYLEFQFLFREEPIVIAMSADLSTARMAKAHLKHEIAADSPLIYHKGRIVQGFEKLKANVYYEIIDTLTVQTVFLNFVPVPADRFKQGIRAEFGFDMAKCPTAAQLCSHLSGLLNLSGEATLMTERGEIEKDVTIEFLANRNLWLQYSGPLTDDVTHTFCIPTLRRKFAIAVERLQKVIDVKFAVISSQNIVRRLPAVLSLTFWGVELENGDVFCEYGIPAHAKIVVEIGEKHRIRVKELQDETIYFFAESDTVGALELLFYYQHPNIPKGSVGVFNGETRVPPKERILQFENVLLAIRPPHRDFEFVVGENTQTLRLRVDATVGDAMAMLAEALEVSPQKMALRSGGQLVASFTQRLDTFRRRMVVTIPQELTGESAICQSARVPASSDQK
jgi:hypothetical protein